jgi:hypothetical protein
MSELIPAPIPVFDGAFAIDDCVRVKFGYNRDMAMRWGVNPDLPLPTFAGQRYARDGETVIILGWAWAARSYICAAEDGAQFFLPHEWVEGA